MRSCASAARHLALAAAGWWLGGCEPRVDVATSDASGADALLRCGPWSEPIPIATLSTARDEREATLHPVGDMLVFVRDGAELWSVLWASETLLGTPTRLEGLELDGAAHGPAWSPSGEQLFYVVGHSLYASSYLQGVFFPPAPVDELAGVNMLGPTLSRDGLELYYATAESPSRIARATRASPASPWVESGVESQLDISAGVGQPTLSHDSLTMYFQGGEVGATRVYAATRASTGERFGAPALVAELSDLAGAVADPALSRDGRSLFVAFAPEGSPALFDLYRSVRSCM